TFLQAGFPIRKSPDHSSVVSFPGLIADSYVLHRLLVPRHPPIALSSLLLLQRCSRPLCSSQGTGGVRHHSPDMASGRVAVREVVPPLARRSETSGPNSVPGRRPGPFRGSTPLRVVLTVESWSTPIGQCSTSGACPAENVRLGPGRMDELSSPYGSLERR